MQSPPSGTLFFSFLFFLQPLSLAVLVVVVVPTNLFVVAVTLSLLDSLGFSLRHSSAAHVPPMVLL